jgi:cell division protease FtsH
MASPENGNQEPGSDRRPDDEGPKSMPLGMLMLLLLCVGVLLIWIFNSSGHAGTEIRYDFFITQLDAKNVTEVEATQNVIEGKWVKIPDKDGDTEFTEEFHVTLPDWAVEDPEFRKRLTGVKQSARSSGLSAGTQIMLWLIMPAMLLVFFFVMMRRNSDPMGSGFLGTFSRSPAKRFQSSDQRTTFKDVAAMDQAKSELMEIVEFLKSPAKFQRLGAQIPKGVLLVGSPGTGKTLMARAIAGEAGVPFYSINGSEFIQMFVGVGASRVRDLFQNAKDHSPCIIFIDEIDAVGRHRGAGLGGGHDEREQTLNQILSEMDGFEQTASVIVVAATNRPDVLDPALMRPGRFDRHVTVERPTKEGREQILKVHTKKVPLGDDIKLKEIAQSTTGFTGAELKNLVNEAALLAVRANRNCVNTIDFERAKDRVLMGPKREEKLTQQARRMTAYHEAGHALVGWFLQGMHEVEKVSIIPRGRMLGVTQFQPNEENLNVGEQRLQNHLAMTMGGRAAEKLIFEEFSVGAEGDLKDGTALARRMVARWGMSPLIGPVAYRQSEDHPFLGKEIHEHREFSEETARVIDQEVTALMTRAQETASILLTERRDELELITDQLMEHEVLNRDDLMRLLGKPAGYEERDESEEQDEAEAGLESVEGPAGLSDESSDEEDVSIESETIDEKLADQNELGTVDEKLLNQANRQLREGDS